MEHNVPVSPFSPGLVGPNDTFRFWFSSPAGEIASVGWGKELIRSNWAELASVVETATDFSLRTTIPAFLFIAFPNTGQHDACWREWPEVGCVLPESAIVWREGTVTQFGQNLPDITQSRQPIPVYSHRSDAPNTGDWARGVESALRHIEEERLQKVVLARKTVLVGETALDASTMLYELRRRGAKGTTFAVSLPGCGEFAGVTPETLFSLRSGEVSVDVVAGTTIDTQADIEADEKIRLEHEVLRLQIERRLGEIAEKVRLTKSVPRQFGNLTHLAGKATARLHRRDAITSLLRTLHPTAALCGEPTEAALEVIGECEAFERGVYGGAIGLVDGRDAQFAVAIRSFLLRAKELTLFAGAGIVPGSNAAREWDELEGKLALPLSIVCSER